VSQDPFGAALARIRAGGLLAYPTETVWGLGADATREGALARLRRWKGRGEAQPLSLLVSGLAALDGLGCAAGPRVRALAAAFWPGPLTLVVPCRRPFGAGVARADGAVGLRCSSHPAAAELARRLALAGVGPITATSLNRSGEPAARTRAEALALCAAAPGDAGPALFAGECPDAGGDAASTVVDATGPRLRVLRWGALGPSALAPLLGADAPLLPDRPGTALP